MSTPKGIGRTEGYRGSRDAPPNMNIDTPESVARAVEWQLALFAKIDPGGMWLVPRSGTIYTVHHARKTVVRALGFAPEPVIERVIKEAGWTVLEMKRAT